MSDFLIHYEEYEDNDFPIRISESLVTDYFHSIGYSLAKSELIVGALEKLAITIDGFEAIFQDDERFYKWAKEVYRKEAASQFGYAGYLLAWVDSYGQYQETRFETFREAKREFNRIKSQNLPAAVLEPKLLRTGWKRNPIIKVQYKKLGWLLERKHFKWKPN